MSEELEGYAVIPRSIQRSATVSPYAKLVYLALSSRANARQQCWPSLATIAREASCSEGTARKALAELHDLGVVYSQDRPPRPDGGQTSRLYTLMTPPSPVAPGGVQEVNRGGAPAEPAPPHQMHPNVPNYERAPVNVNPPTPQGGQQLALLEVSDEVEPYEPIGTELFEEAWKHWPRKESKKTARERFARLTRAKGGKVGRMELAGAIIQHGDAYRAWPEQEQQAVPYLASWLNAERWTEPLPQPRAARGTHPGILDRASEVDEQLRQQMRQQEEDPWTLGKLTR